MTQQVFSKIIPNRTVHICSSRDMYQNVIAAPTGMATNANNSSLQQSQDGHQKKLWRVHTLGFCRVMGINEIPLHTTWVNLTNRILSKKNQT